MLRITAESVFSENRWQQREAKFFLHIIRLFSHFYENYVITAWKMSEKRKHLCACLQRRQAKIKRGTAKSKHSRLVIQLHIFLWRDEAEARHSAQSLGIRNATVSFCHLCSVYLHVRLSDWGPAWKKWPYLLCYKQRPRLRGEARLVPPRKINSQMKTIEISHFCYFPTTSSFCRLKVALPSRFLGLICR